ncbi:MAG: alanine racemase [Gammaproteobacteria bacterium]
MIPATYAVLDLDAVRHNLEIVRNYAPNAKIMAVVKANGYGHGLIRIAQALDDADAFAVARVDEGIRLRTAGFNHRIAVLEGFTFNDELDEFIVHELEPVIHSFSQVDIIERRPETGKISVWLKLDTGMNRLGFKAVEFDSVYRRLNRSALIKHPVNLMTHLANADDKNDDKTLKQTALFTQLAENHDGPRSIANSAGILGWPATISDWVRPGIMLYGISPFPGSCGKEFGLKPVMSLYARLIAVKTAEKGETVGYGTNWPCEKPTTLGVIAIGYGDGYPRYAEPGTPVLVNGRRVPLIGRVSMDMITVDLESQPAAQPGDPVVLWGSDLPVEEIALHAGTIPYTLVCGITQRVQIVEERIKKHLLMSRKSTQ